MKSRLFVVIAAIVLLAGCAGSWGGVPFVLAPQGVVEGLAGAQGPHPLTLANGVIVTTKDFDMRSLFLPSTLDWTPADEDVLTPTTNVVSVASSGAIAITLVGTCTDGQPLTLYGADAYTITVNDTNVRTSTGSAITFGQYDLLLFVCQDNEWIEIAAIANS